MAYTVTDGDRKNRSRRMTASEGRAGMTLIEVMVAMTIFVGALLSMAAFTGRFAQTVSQQKVRAVAAQLAADRLELVKAATRYAAIESMYANTENGIPGFPAYARETLVMHVGGDPADLEDYKIVTVIVRSPGLRSPLKRSTTISSF